MENLTNIKKKICLLGAFGVGKTSLVQRFIYDRFDEKYLTTLGVNISQKIMPPQPIDDTRNLVQYTFLIWDIAGMEKFTPMVKTYYQGASAGIAVADISRDETFEQVEIVCKKFKATSADAKLILIGNKSDLVDHTDVQEAKLKEIAGQFDAEWMLASAKTGWGVSNVFLKIAKKLGEANGSD